jgi:peptidoglycan/LPS O-acetylase OafA/YrhL
MGFHFYPRFVPGGPFSLCLFFALSGYLITSIALREMEAGQFSLRKFYGKRIRRLLPASFFVLAVLAVVWMLLDWSDTETRTDFGLAALQISNWQQIWEGRPYGMQEASPVLHYWSLAIEEQVYLVLPVVFVMAGLKRLKYVLPALFACSVIGLVLAAGNRTMAYYGTHIRAAEILAGAFVAVVMHKRAPVKPLLATVVSIASFGLIVAGTFVFSLNDAFIYQGGMIISGVLSAALVGVLTESKIKWLFEWRPFVFVGKISYGAYLLHWCIYVSLDRTSLVQWMVPLATVVLTFVLADVMLRVFENPMRFRVSTKRFAMVVAVIGIVGAGSMISVNAAPLSFEEVEVRLKDAPTGETTSESTVEAPNALRVGFVGDSKMVTFRFGAGVMEFIEPIFVYANSGCPLGRGGWVTVESARLPVDPKCDWNGLPATPVDVVVVWYGSWDTSGRKVDALGDNWYSVDDPEYAAWLRAEYLEYFELLHKKTGASLIAVLNVYPNADPNLNSYNKFLESLDVAKDVRILDAAEFFSTVETEQFLPDGVHLTNGYKMKYSDGSTNSARDFQEMWLTPMICSTAREVKIEAALGLTCGNVTYVR